MKYEGDGRQYWLVLNPDPRQEERERVLELLKLTWDKTPELDLVDVLGVVLPYSIYDHRDDELIQVLEEKL